MGPAVYFWLADCRDPTAKGHIIKIGRAKNIIERSKSIQTSCPHRMLQLWGLWPYNMDHIAFEQRLHEDLSSFHKGGEWFEIPTVYWRFLTEYPDLNFPEALVNLVVDNGKAPHLYAGNKTEDFLTRALKDAALQLRQAA